MGRPHAGGSKALEGRVGLHVSTSQAARARVQVHGRPCYPYHAIVMGTWWTPCRANARKVMPSGGSSCGHRGGGARPRASDDRRAPTYPTAIRGTAGERAGRRRGQHMSKRPEQDHQGSTGATARFAASAVSPGRLASAAPTTNCATTAGATSGCTRSSRPKFGGSSSVPDPERYARCSVGRRCGVIFMPSGALSPGHGGRMGRRAAVATKTIGHRHRAGCRPSPIRVLPSRRDKE